ncbi:hypothetical protein ASE75_12070 [Sphingomonas sp. Leaf17]|uniref:hypothetical protein n=1 Tax=Sphingomonas sp. Leaf17 TaxID=1735683 RepID=UPI0006F4B920|nr:hypothetical protein [Sphingomonas sp. Leaf17]KQM63211.1 hypothetical protein ASE75_12070 [Sphingomonas sp. Leaf17]
MPAAASRLRPALYLLAFAFALRIWDFGNPVIHVDEQYYLLVGDRMLHGAVPYIDIWDRKPIGLFLLFAALRLLPGDGILAYQLAATVAAVATAWLVHRAALLVGARPRGALAAGAIYLIGLSLLGGRGGQSPVFYNLLMAGAALLTLRLPRLARGGGAIVANGLAACLLAGIAIQMKYTPAVEGAFFGLAHLWYLHRARRPLPVILGGAVLLALAGLLPTLAAIGWYAAQGHAALDAFWFANFTSIALRAGYPADQIAMRLLGIVAQLSPLGICAAFTWRRRARGDAGAVQRLGFGWLAAAVLGFLAIGTFFDHYALPLVAPLAIMAAPMLGRSNRALVATLGLGLTLFVVERGFARSDRDSARALAHVVAANTGNRCPYVFIGDTVTYLLARTCLPTPYAFPNLLAYATEQGATGIDEAAEVRRILATRPPVIVTSDRRLSIWNPASITAVRAALARDYRPVFSTPRASWNSLVYLRNDRPFRTSPPARP